jgi:hypothetical protein
MNLPVTLSLVVLAVTLVACGPEVPAATPGVSSEPSAPSAAAGSPEGGDCGDDVAIQKKCAAGLVCAPNPKAPVSEHTPGICKKP